MSLVTYRSNLEDPRAFPVPPRFTIGDRVIILVARGPVRVPQAGRITFGSYHHPAPWSKRIGWAYYVRYATGGKHQITLSRYEDDIQLDHQQGGDDG